MRKILFLAIVLLIGTSFIATAQSRRGKELKKTPEEAAQKKTDKMVEVMGLSATMKDKVYDINLKAAKDLHAVKDEIKEKYPKKETRKANKEKIKEEFNPKTKEIKKTRRVALKGSGITEAQWDKWKKYKAENKGKEEDDVDDDMK